MNELSNRAIALTPEISAPSCHLSIGCPFDPDEESWNYQISHYGLNADKRPAFWSFTCDGGQFYGELADVSEMAEGAKGFHADMPSGLARFGFWPSENGMI